MISDRQNHAWIVASAAQFMANNNIETVNSHVINFVLHEFVPKEEISNDLIEETLSSLATEVEMLM